MFAGHELTYAELNSQANRVAWWLAERQLGPGSVVAVRMRRGLPLAVTILGIVKAGGGYLPLDRDDPQLRHAAMLRDAGAALIISDASVGDGLADVPACELPAGLDRYPDTNPPQATWAGSLLYVVYTSGSTGRPKGIAMSHGPTAALMQWAGKTHRRQSRTLHYFPITSDVGSYELFATWLSGGCVIMTSDQDRYDVDRLARLIGQHEVETVLLPFLALDQLARHYPRDPDALKSLREIVTTGDRLVLTPAIKAMCADLPVELLENQWGSTEVNVVTTARLRPPAQEWPQTPGIGRPVGQARVYVLDAGLAYSPVNVAGDLYVGGGVLSRGYAGRPDLTAAAFVPDPFSTTPGARLYRTGDLGRWRPDGELEFLGRADFQVKLHGYRVEPGEIESALRAQPGVAEAVVVLGWQTLALGWQTPALRDPGGERASLIAYLVPDGGQLSLPELRTGLRDHLPSYMVPEHFVVLDRLPTTTTGKVDRARLPAPVLAEPEPTFTGPRDETEKAIAEVWQDMLGVDDIDVDDNFFALGGHSLLVNQLVFRLRERLAVDVPLRALFEAPTVATLADWVRESGGMS